MIVRSASAVPAISKYCPPEGNRVKLFIFIFYFNRSRCRLGHADNSHSTCGSRHRMVDRQDRLYDVTEEGAFHCSSVESWVGAQALIFILTVITFIVGEREMMI